MQSLGSRAFVPLHLARFSKNRVKELYQRSPMVCHRASFAFPEKPERALFGSRKVREETVFVLLFRLYEKVTKKYPKGLLTSGLPGNGSKFRAVELFDKAQTMCLSENFYAKLPSCAI